MGDKKPNETKWNAISGKKPKIAKIKTNKRQSLKITASSLLWAAIALVVTVALFIGLLFLQNYLSDEVIYKSVVIAKTDIPENTIITKENAEKYLTMKNINILDTPAGALQSADTLVNTKTKINVYSGEIFTQYYVTDINKYTDNFIDPVEVSIPVASAENADGGKIRPGDVINVTMMYSSEQVGRINSSYTSDNTTSSAYEKYLKLHAEDEEILSEEEYFAIYGKDDYSTSVNANAYNYNSWADCVLQNIYVTRVLNASGEDIKSTDTNSVAATIIFSIERESEQAVINAIDNCLRMHISKVLTIDADKEFISTEEILKSEETTETETTAEMESETMTETETSIEVSEDIETETIEDVDAA